MMLRCECGRYANEPCALIPCLFPEARRLHSAAIVCDCVSEDCRRDGCRLQRAAAGSRPSVNDRNGS
jgi:hypothetical protein